MSDPNQQQGQGSENPQGTPPPSQKIAEGIKEAAREPAPTVQSAGKDDNNMAMLAHLLGIFTGFIGALVIWLIKKDDSPFVEDQGKEALNFQITVVLVYLIGGVTSCIVVGLIILPAAWIANLVLCIMGAVAASKGQAYRYPFAIRLIK